EYLPCSSTITATRKIKGSWTSMPLRPGAGADAHARLLLVDRDPTGVRTTGEALADCLVDPAAIETARAGKEAADLLRSNDYDVVLIDLSSIGDLAEQTEDAVARIVKL